MDLPKYFGLVRIIAQLGALIGCIAGVVAVFGGFAAFRIGFIFGMTAISGGMFTILGSLAGLGVAYCFLAIVEAQIDTRNAIVNYIDGKTSV